MAHGEGNHLFGLVYSTYIYLNWFVCFDHFGLCSMGTAQNGISNFFPLWKESSRGETVTRLICKPFLVLTLLTFNSREEFFLPNFLFLIDFIYFLGCTGNGFTAKIRQRRISRCWTPSQVSSWQVMMNKTGKAVQLQTHVWEQSQTAYPFMATNSTKSLFLMVLLFPYRGA